jgi:hypothetical protein
MDTHCSGEHDFYVADVASVSDEGTVAVIALCRHCGKVVSQHVAVTSNARSREKGK